MKRMQLVLAIAGLFASGQACAWETRVYNNTDYPIIYNHRKSPGGWGDWHRIEPHSNKKIGGSINIIKQIAIRADMGDGDINRIVVGDKEGSWPGRVIVHVYRSDNGIWSVEPQSMK